MASWRLFPGLKHSLHLQCCHPRASSREILDLSLPCASAASHLLPCVPCSSWREPAPSAGCTAPSSSGCCGCKEGFRDAKNPSRSRAVGGEQGPVTFLTLKFSPWLNHLVRCSQKALTFLILVLTLFSLLLCLSLIQPNPADCCYFGVGLTGWSEHVKPSFASGAKSLDLCSALGRDAASSSMHVVRF